MGVSVRTKRLVLNGVRPTGEPKHQHHCRSLPDQPPRAAVAALPSKEDRCPPPVTPPSRASRPRPLRSQRFTFGVPGYHQEDRRRGLRFYLGPNRRRLRPLVVPYAPERGAASAASARWPRERPRPPVPPPQSRGVDVCLAVTTYVWQPVCLVWRPARGLPYAQHGRRWVGRAGRGESNGMVSADSRCEPAQKSAATVTSPYEEAAVG